MAFSVCISGSLPLSIAALPVVEKERKVRAEEGERPLAERGTAPSGFTVILRSPLPLSGVVREGAFLVCSCDADFKKTLSSHSIKKMKTPDIVQGSFEMGVEPTTFYTSGVAACIGIAAKCFSERGELIKTALMHYDSTSSEEFKVFCWALAGPAKEAVGVKKCELYLAGGYLSCTEDDMERGMKVGLKREIMGDLFLTIRKARRFWGKKGVDFSVRQYKFNPWGMPEDIEKYEREIDQLGFGSLTMAITDRGDLLLVDECSEEARSLKKGAFLQFKECFFI